NSSADRSEAQDPQRSGALPEVDPRCAPKHSPSSTKSSNPFRSCGGIFDWDKAQIRLKDLNSIVEDPALWDNPQRAQKLLRERQHLDSAPTAPSRPAPPLPDPPPPLPLA